MELKPLTLLVDDDEVFRRSLGRALRRRGFEVQEAAGPASALAVDGVPERAVVDLKMPEGSGLSLIPELLTRFPGIQIVVLTGYGSIATAVEAMRLGALNYLPKPADADEVLAAFEPEEVSPEHAAPSLARAEWEHINRVLTDCDHNVSEAARRLGLHRRSLQRKLSKYPPNK